MVTSVTKPRVGHRNRPKNLRLLEPTDMTVHQKALEKYFPMVRVVFTIQPYLGKNAFSEFFLKKPQLLNS
jgi:hypothetical protein